MLQENMVFEDFSTLAKADPETFEALRREAIEEFIRSAPADNQQRLRCLQWRIDQIRERAPNPLSACVAITDMMWESFQRLDEVLNDVRVLVTAEEGDVRPEPSRQATVIPFRPRRDR